MLDLRQHIYNQWKSEASYVDTQWGQTLHVPILSEDIQDQCQLQETHEDTQVCGHIDQ